MYNMLCFKDISQALHLFIRDRVIYKTSIDYILLIIILFALSIMELSREAR